ncbi:hypothetical protein F7725_026177 [Dissostichus mawsoni]|uniref:Uncharacterized protein n=1 Tax=Dissostichus mawsoni TaxID=36200 RepID=A0A7J5X6A9_DISMA|nr:hypothetical protein F7725_026177 [Dissostichus mawsoni]
MVRHDVDGLVFGVVGTLVPVVTRIVVVNITAGLRQLLRPHLVDQVILHAGVATLKAILLRSVESADPTQTPQ